MRVRRRNSYGFGFGQAPDINLGDYGPGDAYTAPLPQDPGPVPEHPGATWDAQDPGTLSDTDIEDIMELRRAQPIRPVNAAISELASLLPSWYQPPWDLNLRPKRMGIVYTPEIFGIGYFPGSEIGDDEWNRFLLALHRTYSKLYALVAGHPDWRGPAGIDALAKETLGSQQFVQATQVITPAALVLTLHPFFDPFYTLSPQGMPQANSGNEATFAIEYPELAMAVQEYEGADPQTIPVNMVLPPLERKLSQLSDYLGLDQSEALLGYSVPISAGLPSDLPGDPTLATAPTVRKPKNFLQKNWMLLALLGGGLYLMQRKKS